MESVWQDLRLALRALRRSPGLTAVIVLTLALGIGANASIFSVVNAVLLQPLPYAHGERLVQLRQYPANDATSTFGFSPSELGDYRSAARSTDGLVEYHTMWFNLLGHGDPERVQTGVVSWNYFDVLGVRPVLGRGFLPSEDALGAEPVLVLGYAYWQRRFGGDPRVIGRTVEMNDRTHTIVGVMPAVPQYPNDNDVWMPWYACPFRSSPNTIENRQARMLTVFGRLAPATTADGAHTDLARVQLAMRNEYPDAYPQDTGVGLQVVPLREQMVSNARTRFLVLAGMAGLVLLIACANVANLTLARVARREQELAVRAALGANRGRLLRQLLTESVLLALIGGLLGVAFAAGVTDLLVAFAARFTPRAQEVRVDGWVVAFTFAVATATGAAIGAVPALLLGKDLASRIRDGGRAATTGAARVRARTAFVGAQVALAFVLLVAAGLTARSLLRLLRVDPGFRVENVLTMRLDLDFATRLQPENRRAFYDPLLERVSTLPGVVAVGLANNFPLNGGMPSAPVQIEGRAAAEEGERQLVDIRRASPGYLEALRVPLLAGRYLSGVDRADGEPIAVISESMARRYWPSASPLDARISFDGENWSRVVGVVADVRQQGLDTQPADEVYLPLDANPPLGASLMVRTSGEPAALVRRVTEIVHSIDPRQPVAFVRTLAEVHRESVATPRVTAVLLGLFAVLALGIAAAGIAGVVAYTVGQRTREIGIRMALGARPRQVLGMLIGQGLLPVLAGLGVGVAVALAAGRWLGGLLFEVTPTDMLTYAGVFLVLLAVALVSIYLPARRASAVDPMVSFRAEA